MMPAADSPPPPISLAQWLPVLLRWLPCQHAVVVGQQATAPSGVELPNTRTVTEWVAEQDGPVTLYHASFRAESGLLPAENLRSAWPSIKTIRQEQVQAHSLDTLLLSADAATQPNWLWVHALPAIAVFRGAFNTLKNTDVVLARVLLAAEGIADAGLPGLQNWMASQGFLYAGTEPERNPALGTALFVRNHASSLQTQCAAEAKTKAEALAALDVQAKLAAERQAALEAACKSIADVQADLTTEIQIKSSLIAENTALKHQLAHSARHNKIITNENSNEAYLSIQEELARLAAEVDLIKELMLQGRLRR